MFLRNSMEVRTYVKATFVNLARRINVTLFMASLMALLLASYGTIAGEVPRLSTFCDDPSVLAMRAVVVDPGAPGSTRIVDLVKTKDAKGAPICSEETRGVSSSMTVTGEKSAALPELSAPPLALAVSGDPACGRSPCTFTIRHPQTGQLIKFRPELTDVGLLCRPCLP